MASSVLNKHQLKTEATRRKLLNAARRIFTRSGFEAARIEDIASEAGYTRGAFYAHFQSKEDLFFALLEEQSSLHLERLSGSLRDCINDAARLAYVRDFYISRVSDKQWSILVVEFKLYALRHPKLRARLAKSHRAIRSRLKMGIVPAMFPDELASEERLSVFSGTILQAVLHGIALEHAYDPTSLSEKDASRVLGQIFDVLLGFSVDHPAKRSIAEATAKEDKSYS